MRTRMYGRLWVSTADNGDGRHWISVSRGVGAYGSRFGGLQFSRSYASAGGAEKAARKHLTPSTMGADCVYAGQCVYIVEDGEVTGVEIRQKKENDCAAQEE